MSSTSKKSEASNNGGTLSRSGLYAPLKAFDDDGKLQGDYKNKKLPKNATTINFLSELSKEYSLKTPITAGKNNGCRALTQNTYDELLRNRALTLVGGGINSTITKKKRKGKQHALLVDLKKLKKLKASKDVSESKDGSTWKGLSELNQRWVKYMHELTKEQRICVGDEGLSSAVIAKMCSLFNQAELVGSSVKIITCPAKRNLEAKDGILISHDDKAWRIATLPRKFHDGKSDPRVVKVMTVPRKNSRIAVRMPVDVAEDTTVVCIELK